MNFNVLLIGSILFLTVRAFDSVQSCVKHLVMRKTSVLHFHNSVDSPFSISRYRNSVPLQVGMIEGPNSFETLPMEKWKNSHVEDYLLSINFDNKLIQRFKDENIVGITLKAFNYKNFRNCFNMTVVQSIDLQSKIARWNAVAAFKGVEIFLTDQNISKTIYTQRHFQAFLDFNNANGLIEVTDDKKVRSLINEFKLLHEGSKYKLDTIEKPEWNEIIERLKSLESSSRDDTKRFERQGNLAVLSHLKRITNKNHKLLYADEIIFDPSHEVVGSIGGYIVPENANETVHYLVEIEENAMVKDFDKLLSNIRLLQTPGHTPYISKDMKIQGVLLTNTFNPQLLGKAKELGVFLFVPNGSGFDIEHNPSF